MKIIERIIAIVIAIAAIFFGISALDLKEKTALSQAELQAKGDSLLVVRARIDSLEAIADSLLKLASEQDTVYLRGRTIYIEARDSTLADTGATPAELRAVIELGDQALFACDTAKETCEERRANAEQRLESTKEEHRIESDSLKIEVKDRDVAIVKERKETRKQKLYTAGAFVIALLAWLK